MSRICNERHQIGDIGKELWFIGQYVREMLFVGHTVEE